MSHGQRIKEGRIRRYKNKLFGGKWEECKVVLYQDSTFVWFEDTTESSPRGCIQLNQLAPYFAVGVYTTRLPHRPALPPGARIDHVLAFGTGPSKEAKIYWFLCANDEDLNAWNSRIVSTLPPPPPPPQQMAQAPPAYVYSQGGPPPQPAYYNPGPGYAQPGGYQQPAQYALPPRPQGAPYYQPAPMAASVAPTTAVMAPSSYPAYGGGSRGPGWGTAAAGVGTGMLAGGLMGYALGNMMQPHGWGSGYGYGGGPGMPYGGNDTTIINNYSTTNTTNNDTFNDSGTDTFDYGGAGTYDDFNYAGGNDNFDFAGQDAGGDFDFGGGDFD